MTAGPLKVWLDRGDRLLRLRLARPKANIIDAAMISALSGALEEYAGSAGTAAVLLDAVFALEEGEIFPEAPVKIGREWVIFRLVNRTRPDEEAFTDSVRESTRDVLETLKKKEAVDLYIQQLRAKATEDKALRVNSLSVQDGRS